MLAIELLTLFVLGFIAWEDLRERSIHWWLLPLLATCLILQVIQEHGLTDQVLQASWNLAFLGLQFVAVLLLMWLRHRDPRVFGRSIGIGDLLFFFVLAIGLSQADFILFLLSGLALCVPAHFLLIRRRSGEERTVPLAGLLSIYLAIWQVWSLAGLSSPFNGLAEYVMAHG